MKTLFDAFDDFIEKHDTEYPDKNRFTLAPFDADEYDIIYDSERVATIVIGENFVATYK